MKSPYLKTLLMLLPLTCSITLFCTPQPDYDDSQKIEIIPVVQNTPDNSTSSHSDSADIEGEVENYRFELPVLVRARFFIFYGDTTLYDPKIVFREATCKGTRVPVQIRASTNGLDTLGEFNNEFAIEMNPTNLQAFKSASTTDTIPITTARLVNGIVKIYIEAKIGGSIRDGMITISNLTNGQSILSATRSGINFTSCITGIRGID